MEGIPDHFIFIGQGKKFCYTWRITDFDKKMNMNNGQDIRSVVFNIKTPKYRNRCYIQLFPNGIKYKDERILSLCLCSTEPIRGLTVFYSVLNEDKEEVIRIMDSLDEQYSYETEFKPIATHSLLHDLYRRGLLTKGILTLKIEISCTDDGVAKKSQPVTSQLSVDMKSMLDVGKYTDFTIVCGDKEFNCHKAVLSARSQVFDAMLTQNMVEKNSNRAEILDFDADVVRDMIQFIYSGEVSDMKVKAVHLLPAADKYDLTHLKELCVASLCETISTENVLDLLIMAYVYELATLRTLALQFTVVCGKDIIVQKDWRSKLENYPSIQSDMYVALVMKNQHK